MKALFTLLSLSLSVSAFAIPGLSEGDVQKELGADKVIQISKYAVESILETEECQQLTWSRSASAFVVKKGYSASIYITPSNLSGLTECAKL